MAEQFIIPSTLTQNIVLSGYGKAGIFHKVISTAQLAGELEIAENTSFDNAVIFACAKAEDLMERGSGGRVLVSTSHLDVPLYVATKTTQPWRHTIIAHKRHGAAQILPANPSTQQSCTATPQSPNKPRRRHPQLSPPSPPLARRRRSFAVLYRCPSRLDDTSPSHRRPLPLHNRRCRPPPLLAATPQTPQIWPPPLLVAGIWIGPSAVIPAAPERPRIWIKLSVNPTPLRLIRF
ncbi:hypothetical protein U1Q18_029869 [Sarracenia purpurea var. burkii]